MFVSGCFGFGLSRCKEEAYVGWIRGFVPRRGKRHPRDVAQADVEVCLTSRVVNGKVSASAHNSCVGCVFIPLSPDARSGFSRVWVGGVNRCSSSPAQLMLAAFGLGVRCSACLGALEHDPEPNQVVVAA